MTIISDVKNKTKEWLFTVAIKKAVVKLAQLIVAFAVAKGITFSAVIGGIAIDLSNVNVMTAAIFSILEIVRNFLKIKFPKYFGWL